MPSIKQKRPVVVKPDKDNVFSDDEEEQKFINEVTWTTEAFWAPFSIPWNTIHGIPWDRRGILGQGTYGKVYVGQRASDQKLIAVKSIKVGWHSSPERQKQLLEMQLAEIRMMRLLKYKYIVRCLGCGRSNGKNGLDNQPCLDVFQEYCVRGSLKHIGQQRKGPFPEDPHVRQYTYDLLKALQYMQRRGVVHGDIKMSNLLLADDCIKLGDWGGAKQLTEKSWTQLLIGTRGYRAPEVQEEHHQDHASDVFSLGCTVIEMLTTCPPEDISTLVWGHDPLYKRSLGGDTRLKMPFDVSDLCKDFLQQCLQRESKDRWTADELLHHPFISKRIKNSKLPYEMVVPSVLSKHILQHPTRPERELSDGWPSRRVRAHLSRSGVPKAWSSQMPPLLEQPGSPVNALPKLQLAIELFESKDVKSDEVLQTIAGVATPLNLPPAPSPAGSPVAKRVKVDGSDPRARKKVDLQALASLHQQYQGNLAAMQRVNEDYGSQPMLARLMNCGGGAAVDASVPAPPAWNPGADRDRSS